LGIFCGAVAIYKGIHEVAVKDRYVSVKGLSEREVKADRVTWPLTFSIVSNDLSYVWVVLDRKQASVLAFLKKNGIPENEIYVAAPRLEDRQAESWNSNAVFRYQVSVTITVVTANVDKVLELRTRQGELMREGINMSNNDWSVNFEFTGLNELKPSMVEEATRNARAVAQKFAADAQCELGSIRQASQGQFSIEPLNDNTPYIKKVRVVTTVDYFLE
jgi:hypothetical protein